MDSDGLAPLIVGHLVDRCVLGRPNSVIGDQNVEASELRDARAHQVTRRCRASQGYGFCGAVPFPQFAAQLLGCGCRFFVAEENARPGSNKHTHDRRTNSARTAGDECNTAGETEGYSHTEIVSDLWRELANELGKAYSALVVGIVTVSTAAGSSRS